MIRLLFALLLAPVWAQADTIRIATYNVELVRDGPGLLLRDMLRGDDQVTSVVDVIAAAEADILVLQGLDRDADLQSLRALAGLLEGAGLSYPHLLSLPSNRGRESGRDLDGDGRLGEAEDSHGFGAFTGQGAMALLSRHPIRTDDVRDFTDLLWADLPGAQRPVRADGMLFPDPETAARQRLSSTGHWVVPVDVAGRKITVLAYHAGPPVFDGPEDANGLRNADETRFWQRLMDGDLGMAPKGPFVIAGSANLDPVDGDGRGAVMAALLADPRLQDAAPTSAGGAEAEDQGHAGANALDTVDWPPPGPGRLRVDYVLPSADLTVTGSGVLWPRRADPLHEAVIRASRHRLVWVDLAW